MCLRSKPRHAKRIYHKQVKRLYENGYGGSWSFSGDCVSNCYSGTYDKRVGRIPEVNEFNGSTGTLRLRVPNVQ